MGGVDLVIALDRLKIKTKHLYTKIFWHFVDNCKVNAWNLYRCHCSQYDRSKCQMLSLLSFFGDLANDLIHANKPVIINKPSRHKNRSSCDN